MLIYPAIDIRFGHVVRLSLGDYSQMTVYGDDPVRMAKEFRDAGAEAIHVVDLDAARDGVQSNLSIISGIASVGLFTQVGGGARDTDSIRRYIDAGVSRVIIGSAIITNPGFLKKSAQTFPGKIAAGIDAKDGKIAIHGWKDLTDVDALSYLQSLPEQGVDCAIYTDISRDGMLSGSNLEEYRKASGIPGLKLIASGGVSSVNEILELSQLGLHGAIIGKALYDGKLSLREALAAAKGAKA